MSYSLDQCQTRFSPGQTDVMRAYLLTVNSDWLAAGAQGGPVHGTPQLIAPVGSMPVSNIGVKLNWERVPGATHYVVQVARFSSFAVKEHDVIVSDTFFTTKPLLADQTYFWRVRPFNRQYTCTAFSPTEKFETVVAVPNLAEAAGWRLYPTLLRPGQALTVEVPETVRTLRRKALFYKFPCPAPDGKPGCTIWFGKARKGCCVKL